MLEKFIKRDKNEELERILEEKDIEEQAKNLLQGILYKVEVSYKDYKKVKGTNITEEKYIENILRNIQRRCNQIKIVKLSEKVEDNKIQKKLEKNKFYIGENEIIAYPIEEKILYAIEKKSNNSKIVNNKYGIATIPLSNFINTGKNISRIEVLRDFNGWSWTTIKKEIENIEANLVYQTLQILVGEEFLEGWSQDTDGIIDYVELLKEEIGKIYNEETAEKLLKILIQISIINEAKENSEFKEKVSKDLEKLEEQIANYNNTQENIVKITNSKKKASKEIKEIEKILSQESRIREEYEKINAGVPIHKKIFSIRVLKQQLNDKKQRLLNEIEEYNYLLNPVNYLEEKNKILKEKELLEVIRYSKTQKENKMIEFLQLFLQCFKTLIEKETNEEKIVKNIYKFRYFMLLPYNLEKDVKDVEQIEDQVIEVEQKIAKEAIEKKVISKIPFEVIRHVFQTRIIVLEELYYKIITEFEKYYVQIFDENISEEKFEIQPIEKTKINKKTKIFI